MSLSQGWAAILNTLVLPLIYLCSFVMTLLGFWFGNAAFCQLSPETPREIWFRCSEVWDELFNSYSVQLQNLADVLSRRPVLGLMLGSFFHWDCHRTTKILLCFFFSLVPSLQSSSVELNKCHMEEKLAVQMPEIKLC